MKHLQDAIDAASHEDVIYVRPYQTHAQFVGGDPANILPESTANWSISHAKWGLSIIGTGAGSGKASAYGVNLAGSTTVQATPTMLVYAPYVSLENLAFRRGSGTLAGVEFLFADPGTTASSFGNTVYNCLFWKIGATATTGALNIDSAWHTSVLNSTFLSCSKGIYVGFTNSTMQGLTVKGCVFQALTAEVTADIYSVAGCANALIDNCRFNHVLPTGGSPNLYIYMGAASTGLFSNSFIGNTDETIATNTTLNGINYSHIYCQNEGELVNA
jgi:hypothetical protein